MLYLTSAPLKKRSTRYERITRQSFIYADLKVEYLDKNNNKHYLSIDSENKILDN